MCGIVGLWHQNLSSNRQDSLELITRMSDSIRHRGPDDAGHWCEPSAGLSLGHRRLSIIDLSLHGRQPMTSACGRFVIVFNGEIYNFLELREELDNVVDWRGLSDTEVLLEACAQWGVEKAWQRINGMFAYALWDCAERKLYLTRDRLGKKPLYFGWCGEWFAFASEAKSFQVLPERPSRLDRNGLIQYLRYGYIPAPRTIWANIRKLEPGNIAVLSEQNIHERSLPIVKGLWSAAKLMDESNQLDTVSAEEALDLLDYRLGKAVKQRLIADVPIGLFLSGGIDSSLIAAYAQQYTNQPVRSFCIGFEEDSYNESQYAEEVAAILGTKHETHILSIQDAQKLVPQLPQVYDEPFADLSQIPTLLLCQTARESITVALSGDGGDEFFAGYRRYQKFQRMIEMYQKFPASLYHILNIMVKSFPQAGYSAVASLLVNVGARNIARKFYVGEVDKLTEAFSTRNIYEIYHYMIDRFRDPAQWLEFTILNNSRVGNKNFKSGDFENPILLAMRCDAASYLPEGVLVKVDRASMSCSLEVRSPLLDYLFVEESTRFPVEANINNGKGKFLLRSLLSRFLPEKIIDRPKQGFGISISSWLRNDLRDWAESLLQEDILIKAGIFKPKLIKGMWNEHISGRQDWSFHLWSILMFQAWQQEYKAIL